MTEASCLKLITEANKPYNAQGVADMLACQGFKKSQVEKALLSLSESGKLICKEFGKQKLFIPPQDGLPELDLEEQSKLMDDISKGQAECKEEELAVTALRKELACMESTLTLEELKNLEIQRQEQVHNLESKLADVQSKTAKVVSTDEIHKAEAVDMLDDMGVETDEAIGEQLADYQRLFLGNKKMKI
ncbi:hypothetical protein H632_c1979p0 [Helicosporidium sp. ATCC 50920]|nr:hypothetical protein H632_c1979p0 [Helicosporidium sp. ATCC 50920]|eukprot:KDD73634.1 hypothetical protein H632_c1979p0 [Helicosporidium sp. ATCC 50920]